MSASDNLSNLQFSFAHNIGGHQVTATLGEEPVGLLDWAKATGKIEKITVAKEHRRKGIATALLAEGKRVAKEKGLKEPIHSERRSEAGDAWAKSLKEPLPTRKSDREYFG